jgi:hypothetical protein
MTSPETAEPTCERAICAVLAAHASALRDGVEDAGALEVLWRTADALGDLHRLLAEAASRAAAEDTAFAQRCTQVLEAGSAVGRALEDLTFRQAQQQDLARQMADCMATALQRLAAGDAREAARLSLPELAAMYVSDTQRAVHAAAMQSLPAPPAADQEGPRG